MTEPERLEYRMLLDVWTARCFANVQTLGRLLDLVETEFSGKLCPGKWNVAEPITKAYVPGDRSESRLEIYSEFTRQKPPESGRLSGSVYWRQRGKGGAEGFMTSRRDSGPNPLLGIFHISWRQKNTSAGIRETIKFFRSLVKVLKPVLATCIRGDQRLSRYSPGTPLDRVAHADWLMYWGPPYIDLIGSERLKSAPCHRVVEVHGGIETMLTKGPAALRDDDLPNLAFERHVGVELFPAKGYPRKKCAVPRFDCSDILIPREQVERAVAAWKASQKRGSVKSK